MLHFKYLLWLAVGVLLPQLVGSATLMSLLTQSLIYALFALGVGILLRQCGLVSFGHAAFFGISGYSVALLMRDLELGAASAIVLTLVALAIVAFLLGLVVSRIPGIAFGMLTLAIGQTVYLSALKSRETLGGADGLNINWPSSIFGLDVRLFYDPASMFVISWVVMLVTIYLLDRLFRSRFGSITSAIRDNEERARFIGLHVMLPKAVVYALSAVVSGLAGVLSAIYTGFISPETLHWSVSGTALIMTILGGVRYLWGPILGAIFYFFVKEYVGELTDYWMAMLGAVVIFIVVFAPNGVSGLLMQLQERRQKRKQDVIVRRMEVRS
ncbi:branched-chain amino acid ABC transporter permease [Marinobacterium lutimaris]|uniref:Amino acid/amide ABC transporter membrane protein 2, HAAT family n=1 Tax=Marinobacterium lutimaris TaxID=568106 RepID=A0A1H5Y0B8_9GAMM|nr:branched-chain amino acid ABC transporter permease [Marinobacterium lutimaris]SEG17117.1 amino acid/amide ABC transporter membrane protein 2, HAAT family [Marinobacterium lutimaris]